MKHKKLHINGREVDIYDDLFTFEEIARMFIKVRQFAYTATNFSDGFRSHIYGEKHKLKYTFGSREEATDFGIINKLNRVDQNIAKNYIIHRQYVNLATTSDFDTIHIDDNHLEKPKTALYYPHPDWNIHWGGHSFFFNETLDSIEYTAAYKPGRLVVFDGLIPHCGSPPFSGAQDKRYVVTCKFQYTNGE
tara:strand:+ start:1595 stop:2167 length:573 start_codon:yes stop_codon:yes gene_type:complete